MYRLLALSLLALPFALPSEAATSDPLGIAGVWSVTSTFAQSTCPSPNDVGGTQAHSWMVGSEPEGAYSIAVQGETVFPKLRGRVQAGVLRLLGLESDGRAAPAYEIARVFGSDARTVYHFNRSDFALELKDGVLTGSRTITLMVGPSALTGSPSEESPQVYYWPCSVQFTVKGTRN